MFGCASTSKTHHVSSKLTICVAFALRFLESVPLPFHGYLNEREWNTVVTRDPHMHKGIPSASA